MPVSTSFDKAKLEKPPLKLHYLGDRVLRNAAKRIAKVDASTRTLARELLQTMYSSDGIGLAAPQVGIHKQILVLDCEPDEPTKPPLVLINPEIKAFSREVCTAQEGCLSIPEVYLDVVRPRAIEVVFKDETGRPQRLRADGLLARVIQHELDHLHGVLFVDRVQNGLVLAEELKKHNFSLQAVRPIA